MNSNRLENSSKNRKRNRILESEDESESETSHQSIIRNEIEQAVGYDTSEDSVESLISFQSNINQLPSNSIQRQLKMGES